MRKWGTEGNIANQGRISEQMIAVGNTPPHPGDASSVGLGGTQALKKICVSMMKTNLYLSYKKSGDFAAQSWVHL